MKVLVEAYSAEFGGIRTYVENALAQWSRVRPDDELYVLVMEGSTLDTAGHQVEAVRVRRPVALFRPLAQTIVTRRRARQFGADAVLSTLPSTSLRRLPWPHAIVIYDLRHELRPDQFSWGTRLLRNVSYGRGYRVADVVVSISQRSLDDLKRLHPDSPPGVVAHLGADHVHDWPRVEAGSGPAIAFSHHTNKNPDLLLDAWALAAREGRPLPVLRILGAGGQRARLAARVAELGLEGQVELAPFLPQDEFEQAFCAASMIVFPTDFEGFGLPVVEAMALGIPVVIGPERATLEVAGGHASVMADWGPAALVEAVREAQARDVESLEAARIHAATFTWARNIETTVAALEAVAASRTA